MSAFIDFVRQVLQPDILPVYRIPYRNAIVQCCDSLDILRVYPGPRFKRDLFPFLHASLDPLARPEIDDTRERMIAEAASWIEQTEEFWRRREIEDAPTCCEMLLADLRKNRSKYPILTSLLG